MSIKEKKYKVLILLPAILSLVSAAYPWSNGGYSTDFDNPKFGTHDWLAEHALDFLPEHYRDWIDENKNAYLLGTEAPDNSKLNFMNYPCYGDTRRHHIYFLIDGSGIVPGEDDAGVRVQEEYDKAEKAWGNLDFKAASYYAGTMSHYIADVAVFGHVMGKSSPWGSEKHHSDYEKYVQRRTDKYIDGTFEVYLIFDGELDITITPYQAAYQVGDITTFGNGKIMPCYWMDENYPHKNKAFMDSCGNSLNVAANAIADVLFRLSTEAIGVTRRKSPLSTTWGILKRE